MPSTEVWMLRAEMRFRMALSLVLLAGVLAIGVVGIAFLTSFAWPQNAVATPSEHDYPGTIDQFQIREPVQFISGHYWLVRLRESEVVALYYKDPTWGCTVPWRPTYAFADSLTGNETKGWFKNPCSGATYALDGHCVYGPCNRGLDRRPVNVSSRGRIVVDTSNLRLIHGQPGVLGTQWYPVPASGYFPLR